MVEDKIYIQQSAIKRLGIEKIGEFLKNGKYIIQYGKFTPDIQLKIKKLY